MGLFIEGKSEKWKNSQIVYYFIAVVLSGVALWTRPIRIGFIYDSLNVSYRLEAIGRLSGFEDREMAVLEIFRRESLFWESDFRDLDGTSAFLQGGSTFRKRNRTKECKGDDGRSGGGIEDARE